MTPLNKIAHFSIKYGQSLGDRLVIQNVRYSSLLATLLEESSLQITGQITVGYYQRLALPENAWSFMPVDTDTSLVVVPTSWVMQRVIFDLFERTYEIDENTKGFVSEALKYPEKDIVRFDYNKQSLVLGYFQQLEMPPDAWSFVPVTSDEVFAALQTAKAQSIIADSLVRRILESDRYNTKDRMQSVHPSG